MNENLGFEVSRLKGTLEATKHYYAVLIAKNVAKVESVLERIKGYSHVENELSTSFTDEFVELDRKMKRAKSRTIKNLYLELITEKRQKDQLQRDNINLIADIAKDLRQIL